MATCDHPRRSETPLSLITRLVGLSCLLGPGIASAQDLLPAGSPITDAVIVDVTPEGFDAVTGVIPSFLPGDIALDSLGDEYDGALGQCWLGGYGYEVSNMFIDIEIPYASIVPQNGYLDLTFDIQVAINDSSNPFYIWTTLECIDSTCDAYVEPFVATINTHIDMQVVEGPDGPMLDANVGDLNLSYDLTGDNINLSGCALATVNNILDFFGLNLFDIVLSFAGGFIDDAIGDFAPQIEELLEDSFGAANIEQEIDLGGVVATLQIYPGDVEIRPDGMRLSMDGSMDADAAECVAQWDPGGSARVEGDLPAIGAPGDGVDSGQHLGLLMSDEFGNQALYAIWRAGLLCQVVDEELTGFSMNTALMSLFIGDDAGSTIAGLFEAPAPLLILTRPEAPPTLVYNGPNDVVVALEQLGLDFYGELDFRNARLMGVDLQTDVGINLPFDGTTGALAIEVGLSGEDLVPTVVSNEFAPGTDAAVGTAIKGLFDTLVAPILADQLGDLAFNLPGFDGLGLTALEVAPSGPEGDWLGIYANLGLVPYEAAGCDSEDGCGGGCGGGCGNGGVVNGRLALLALPLGLIMIRRRQDWEAGSEA